MTSPLTRWTPSDMALGCRVSSPNLTTLPSKRRRWARSSFSGSTIFFSSRRRYTRSLCDWSSDVCSSDLEPFFCRCDALDGAAARVADSEHSRHARLQEKRLALEPPPAGRMAGVEQVAAGQDVSLGIQDRKSVV